jgi:hypothetical protein
MFPSCHQTNGYLEILLVYMGKRHRYQLFELLLKKYYKKGYDLPITKLERFISCQYRLKSVIFNFYKSKP